MAETVYFLCMLTSLSCAVFLVVGYRRSRTRLLLYACSCFIGLALNNLFLFIDVVVVPKLELTQIHEIDLAPWRIIPALVGIVIFIYGVLEEILFNRQDGN